MPRSTSKSWINRYLESIIPSSDAPENFHLWSAVTIVSAALRRNVYYVRGPRTLFANMFTLLVARPGIGKGESIRPAISILDKSGCANLLADRMTMPFMLGRLHKGFTRVGATSMGMDHTAAVFATELSTFMKASENELDTLNELWDAPDKFGIGTIARSDESIENPALVLLGGTTPKWLSRAIPNDAVGGGFTRRVNFIFAKSNSKITPFPADWQPSQGLINDLKHIGALQGRIHLSQQAIPLFEKLYKYCKEDLDFEDETEATYRVSEWTNVMKLAIVLSVCESDSMIITKPQLERAWKLISQAKKELKIVFSYVGESESVQAGAMVFEFVSRNGFVTANQIMRHMSKTVTWTQLVNDILPTLVNGGMLAKVYVSGTTEKYYDPDVYNANTMAKKVGKP